MADDALPLPRAYGTAIELISVGLADDPSHAQRGNQDESQLTQRIQGLGLQEAHETLQAMTGLASALLELVAGEQQRETLQQIALGIARTHLDGPT